MTNVSNIGMKPTNLNPLFIDQIPAYAHLITREPQTKEQFLEVLKSTYSLDTPQNNLFYIATQKSTFETVRYCVVSNCILFNS